ncbi:MAG: prepilin-type N-terminal cleavage/methylation domain-containing protein [Bacilli bacterium]
MNRKGFTLIELLAVIILIAIIGIITVPNLLTTVNSSKEKSYNILIENIVTAAKTYYEECEYGDLSNTLSNTDKYKNYACTIKTNTCKDEEGNSYTCNYIETTLETLANTGFLSVTDVDDNNKKQVLNPQTKEDMSSCLITITKNVYPSFKVTYTITSESKDEKCPFRKDHATTEENGSEESESVN